MTFWGLRLSARRSALAGTIILLVILLVIALAILHLSPLEAVVGSLLGAVLYWSGETVHQLGHAWESRRVGFPMIGIRYWGLLSTSLYPTDEPPLPGATHIRRALGGPFFSLIYSIITGVLAALLGVCDLLGWIVLFLFLCNLLVFTLGAFLPLGFTDGSTLLYWWNRRW